MLITKEQQESLVDKYVKEKHKTDECIGFIDGINAVLELVKNLAIPVVVCSNCPRVIGLTVGKSYTQLAKHKDIIALVNDYGDLKRYNIAYFE